MLKNFIFILFLLLVNRAPAQPDSQSLKLKSLVSGNDKVRLLQLIKLAEGYAENKPDTSLYYAEQAIELARKLKTKLIEAYALIFKGYAFLNIGNYPQALTASLAALAIAEDPESERTVIPEEFPEVQEIKNQNLSSYLIRLNTLAGVHHYTGIVYGNAGNYNKELYHYHRARELYERVQNPYELSSVFMTLGRVYLTLHKPDSALLYGQKAYDLAMQIGYKKYLGSILLNMARLHQTQGKTQLSAQYFRRAIAASYAQNYMRGVVAGNLALGEIFRQTGNIDSSLHYANSALEIAEELSSANLRLRCYNALSSTYKKVNNKDSTVKYQELVIRLNDSLFNARQIQQFQNIDVQEQQRRQDMEAALAASGFRLKMYALITGLGVFLLIALFLWRNNEQRKRTNMRLHQQNDELQAALRKLETTQKQLIQSEKMASLGELTAGIAHEIQNPLNFVNNFSDVNHELLTEMKREAEMGNLEEVKAIAATIQENEQKISHHGKRADSIVKSMLQHSRATTGEKQSTDINALADEYLRLSYHGLRAKDNNFNANIKRHYDPSVEKVEVIPQDIGRVLLNLFNNAFYAVNEKKKMTGEDYEPVVQVSTKIADGRVEIRVRDNGAGIPEKALSKIYQPFFTTKPTGEGTGLGLSLSYDIITKGHGGNLKVESKEGEGSEFVVQLPV